MTKAKEVLIPHGMTPSGFGLALHNDGMKWWLRPLSPCCGAFIDSYHEYICIACKTLWDEFQKTTDSTIGNNVPADTPYGVLETWIKGLAMFDDTVRVRVTWTD